MTNVEIVLCVYIVILQLGFFGLLSLMQRADKRQIELMQILMDMNRGKQ